MLFRQMFWPFHFIFIAISYYKTLITCFIDAIQNSYFNVENNVNDDVCRL